MNITSRHAALASAAASAAILALGGWLTWTEVQQRRGAREALETRLAQGLEMQGDLRQRRAALESALTRRERASAGSTMRLAPLAALNDTLARLAALAGEFGLEVTAMAPGSAAEKPFYRAVPVAMRARARYPDVPAFFTALHERMPDVCVQAFSLDSEGQSGALGVTLALEWRAAPDDSAGRAGAGGK
ncbi:MAG: type 4a pilus biogenesis protein PilO [Phycisphaerales bacterium]|nr:type 4a pilus biogenesis protein PilO [Phycisphaerales bacterium]